MVLLWILLVGWYCLFAFRRCLVLFDCLTLVLFGFCDFGWLVIGLLVCDFGLFFGFRFGFDVLTIFGWRLLVLTGWFGFVIRWVFL